MPGYSPNPLATKLGIKEGMTVATVGAPKELETWLAPLPAKVRLTTRGAATVPILLCFVTRREDLEARLPTLLARVLPGGALWICWPKKSSAVATDLTEQTLRDVILPTGWVDVKVCAVSDVWSGLRFLRRKAKA